MSAVATTTSAAAKPAAALPATQAAKPLPRLEDLIREAIDLGTRIAEAGGELTPDLEKVFDELNVTMAWKIEGYIVVREQLKALEAYYRGRARENEKAAQGMKNAVARLEYRLKESARRLNAAEFLGTERRLAFRPLEDELVIDSALLPPEWWVTTIEQVESKAPNEKEIIEALKMGEPVPGAKLVKRSQMNVYPNRQAPALAAPKTASKTKKAAATKEKK